MKYALKEFLLTYGWAIIVILFLIFAMWFLASSDISKPMLVIDNSKVIGERFNCVSYSLENCGLSCNTDNGLEYRCLTNYRIVNK